MPYGQPHQKWEWCNHEPQGGERHRGEIFEADLDEQPGRTPDGAEDEPDGDGKSHAGIVGECGGEGQ
jgi:hypothetical protein